MYLNEQFFLSWFHWSRTSAQHWKVRCSCRFKILVLWEWNVILLIQSIIIYNSQTTEWDYIANCLSSQERILNFEYGEINQLTNRSEVQMQVRNMREYRKETAGDGIQSCWIRQRQIQKLFLGLAVLAGDMWYSSEVWKLQKQISSMSSI